MPEPSTRTVDRALTLLSAVCEAGTVTLAEAARSAGLSASTSLRLLRTLEVAGFVRRDEDGYRPGLTLIQLGAAALGHESLVSLARPALRRLVERTGESAYLSVEGRDGHGVYLALEEGTHSVRHTSWVGRSIPLAGTAAGDVLAGRTPDAGFVVVDRGVEPDVTAIAAPVVLGGRTVGALSIVAPRYRVDDALARRLGRLVADEAAAIGRTDATDGPTERATITDTTTTDTAITDTAITDTAP